MADAQFTQKKTEYKILNEDAIAKFRI